MCWGVVVVGVPEKIGCLGEGLQIVCLACAINVGLDGDFRWCHYRETQQDDAVAAIVVEGVELEQRLLAVGRAVEKVVGSLADGVMQAGGVRPMNGER